MLALMWAFRYTSVDDIVWYAGKSQVHHGIGKFNTMETRIHVFGPVCRLHDMTTFGSHLELLIVGPGQAVRNMNRA